MNPWVTMWNTTKPYIPLDTAISITTKCTEVLSAIIFFPSYHPLRYRLIISNLTLGSNILSSNINIAKKTLATTIVDECNRLLTGVGPSIAMGSQYPKIQTADFLRVAIINRNHMYCTSTLNNSNIIPTSPKRL